MLDYVHKTKDVTQVFGSVIERLERNVKESKSAGDEIDKIKIGADDYSMLELCVRVLGRLWVHSGY